MSATEDRVLEAAAHLVAAFGSHRRDEYFDCFDPGATFVFYSGPNVLGSRAAFEAEWDRWVQDEGFRVLSCESRDQAVQLFGDVAIFTHRVATRQTFGGHEVTADERETIVFNRHEDDRWLAVHEHLSPMPETDA
jgi:ketosteroid isomerase-like protein